MCKYDTFTKQNKTTLKQSTKCAKQAVYVATERSNNSKI